MTSACTFSNILSVKTALQAFSREVPALTVLHFKGVCECVLVCVWVSLLVPWIQGNRRKLNNRNLLPFLNVWILGCITLYNLPAIYSGERQAINIFFWCAYVPKYILDYCLTYLPKRLIAHIKLQCLYQNRDEECGLGLQQETYLLNSFIPLFPIYLVSW